MHRRAYWHQYSDLTQRPWRGVNRAASNPPVNIRQRPVVSQTLFPGERPLDGYQG